ADPVAAPAAPAVPTLNCHFEALPFDAASLDLVVLPHALELARDPHRTLREVERVLVPEGRVLIIGFNPASLWGTRQRPRRVRRRPGPRPAPCARSSACSYPKAAFSSSASIRRAYGERGSASAGCVAASASGRNTDCSCRVPASSLAIGVCA